MLQISLRKSFCVAIAISLCESVPQQQCGSKVQIVHSPRRSVLSISDSSRSSLLLLWIKQFRSSPGERDDEACAAKEGVQYEHGSTAGLSFM